MHNGTRVGTIAIVILLLIIAAFIFSGLKKTPEVVGNKYESEVYGFSFEYPDNYVLTEDYIRDESMPHNSVALYEKSNLPNPKNSEGPTAITFNVYANSSDVDLEGWVKQSRSSNFGLGDQQLYPITLDGEPALVYNWDGLYRGKSVVFKSRGSIVMASVAYNADTDTIRRDFERMIFSVKLDK
jgi:hypothetical protein